jgi:hypothetical protein
MYTGQIIIAQHFNTPKTKGDSLKTKGNIIKQYSLEKDLNRFPWMRPLVALAITGTWKIVVESVILWQIFKKPIHK